jgi:ankyrin repeat protein
MVVENHDKTDFSSGFKSTALHMAVGKGNLCVSCYLIDRVADVNITE